MLLKRLFRIIKANIPQEESYPENDSYQKDDYSFNDRQNQYKNTTPPPAVNAREAAYYDALEIPRSASFSEIKAAYKKLIKKYHPDLFNNNQQKRQYAEIVTQKLNEAYEYFENKADNKM